MKIDTKYFGEINLFDHLDEPSCYIKDLVLNHSGEFDYAETIEK
jgi:hypothetical protein